VNTSGVTWLGGGSATKNVPTAETVVFGSAAGKWIVAACAALLVRQGDFDPNLPVRTLLPELPAWAAPIRLHHLVHHTSGLPERPMARAGIDDGESEWTDESALNALASTSRPKAEPGTEFAYSGVGDACLKMLVERASGRPIADFAQKYLFAPLGMISTRFWRAPTARPRLNAIDGPGTPGRPASHCGGGVWSTARDMLRWAEAMQIGALGPRLTALLRQPGKLRHGTTIPYSWGSFILPGDKGPAFAHSGWSHGCITYVIASPATAKSAVVVAFTDDPQPAEALGRQLVGLGGRRLGAP
jgi:CubicO group peptidase (beta-lactamase class C family)